MLFSGQIAPGRSSSRNQRQKIPLGTPTVSYIANSTGRLYYFEGVYENSSTAGSVVFRWGAVKRQRHVERSRRTPVSGAVQLA